MISPVYDPFPSLSSAPAAGPPMSDLWCARAVRQEGSGTRAHSREGDDGVQEPYARADLAYVGYLRDAGHDERVELENVVDGDGDVDMTVSERVPPKPRMIVRITLLVPQALSKVYMRRRLTKTRTMRSW